MVSRFVFVRRLATALVIAGVVFLVTDFILRSFRVPEEWRSYIVAAELLVVDYFGIQGISQAVYHVVAPRGGAVAGLMRTIVRIVGWGIILSSLASVFNVSSAAALTLGSFAGLVTGLAFQTVLGNALAGILLAFIRPFVIGDQVTLAGNTGKVADISIMYTVVDIGDKDVLIPSGTIINSIIIRHKSSAIPSQSPGAPPLTMEKA